MNTPASNQPKVAPQQTSNGPTSKRLVLGCGALVYELVELIKHNPEVDNVVDLHCLPAHLHNTPQLIAGEVDKYLTDKAYDYAEVLVAYGDCGTAGALDEVLLKHGAQRLPGAHCYEFYAGSKQYQSIVDEELGSFFLTDFLVKFFDRLIIQGLGLDRFPELRDVYFAHYKKLIYIAQTQNTELQELAELHARQLELDYEYRFVGFDGLSPAVDGIFTKVEVNHVSS